MAVLFFPKETAPGERRVAATPETVKRLTSKDGHRVLVEAGAGLLAEYPDAEYAEAGATVVKSASEGWAQADVVGKLHPPTAAEVASAKPGGSLVSFLWALDRLDVVRALAAKKVSVFAMDALPRTTRAQKSDALTSQASLAGYKAVLLAAARLPKILPMQMTPAGTIRPARVLILGAGVAGLQAIATARRLGAIVEVSDVRPEVKEQVQSLGATYLEVPVAGTQGPAASAGATGSPASDSNGYATAQSADFQRRQREMLAERVAAADVVITTALIPYQPAPRLVTAEMVRRMRPGSVIVDLAAERGGNVEGTEAGKAVEKDGVTILGEVNLAASVATHASDQYAKNVQSVITDATKKGVFAWDLKDEVVDGALVLHAGDVRHAKTREALGLPPLPPPPPPAPPTSTPTAAAPAAAR